MKCNGMNMTLLEIHEPSDHYSLLKVFQENEILLNDQTWIGGSDDASEGTWVWISNLNTVTYTNWVRGAPNNYNNNENCIVLESVKESFYFKWNDVTCTNHNPYICYQKYLI